MKVFLIVLGIVLIGAGAFFLFSTGDSVEIPEKLFGLWVTDDPKYADRYFELSAYDVAFGVGNGRALKYRIDHIRGELIKDEPLYTITFLDKDGNEYTQSVHFSKTDARLLVFKNQNGIEWYKETE